ncbi:MAG: YbjQ family protein [Burkholderiaceae bacterium]|jgi:uncharacterized protein YbjQ (UPF0145 family)|nr:YbjQ family protein [Burkholderiaceae bacterium]
MDLIINLLWNIANFIALLLTFPIGLYLEKRHYRSIREREARLRDILIFNERTPPASLAGQDCALVSGSVVVGADRFRQWLAYLKSIFGGRLGSLESIMDRGRREAILRMKEDAHRKGANAIFNVKIETAMLHQADRWQQFIKVELFAYGTAWMPRKPDNARPTRDY